LSPTTMKAPANGPTSVKLTSRNQTTMAVPSLIPSVMATSPMNPDGGTRARSVITNSGTGLRGHAGGKGASKQESVASAAPSWPSSGQIWPTADGSASTAPSGSTKQALEKAAAEH